MSQIADKIKQSINDFKEKNGTLTSTNIETETINVACCELLKKYGNRIDKEHDINRLRSSVIKNVWLLEEIKQYTDASLTLYYPNYTEDMAQAANMIILQNISWGGMWNFLRNYFLEKHGVPIDSVDTEICVYGSTNYKRYEYGRLVDHSKTENRLVKFSFLEDKVEVTVSIEPSLSMKQAKLTNKNERVSTYRGYDPDYLFHIHFDKFDEVEFFVLEMPNRSLKIEYYK